MTAEDRLRDAYGDLTQRVARDIDPGMNPGPQPRGAATATPTPTRPRFPRRPALALAAVAVIAAGATALALNRGDGDQGIETGPAESTPADVTTDPDDSSDGNGGGADGTAGSGDPTSGTTTGTGDSDGSGPDGRNPTGERYRVVTSRVEADAADPFLNVRLEPGPAAELLAKLPPTYTGLAGTGRVHSGEDGGTWFEVELIDPVPVNTVIQDTGRPPTGWVNAVFVELLPDGLPVTTDEVPACTGGFDRVNTGGGLSDGYLYAMESARLTDDCLRVVVTFGQGQAPFEWYDLPTGTAPADGLAEVLTTMSGGLGASLDLGPVDGAWPGATDTDQVYAVRRPDRSLDLVTPLPVDGVTVTGLADRGIVVIDLTLGDGSPPPAGAGVVLTSPVLTGSGTVDVVGISRPFEATVGVSIENDAGDPVEAVFSGSDFLGTISTTEYGVGATDWAEAWGMFAVRAEGLAAGSYTMVLNAGTGADNPDTLRVPFSVDSGGAGPELTSDAEQAAASALVDFARSGVAERLPLADEVTLALGSSRFRTMGAAELADRDAWTWDVDDFAGYTGPFSALDPLRRTGLRFTAGHVPHCAGTALDWPAEFQDLRQVNIEPVGIDSCLQWFGVHLFLDEDDRIAAVALDLWEP